MRRTSVVQTGHVPLFGIGLFGDVAAHQHLDHFVAHVGDGLGDVGRRHDLAALLEDHLALVVHHVVDI